MEPRSFERGKAKTYATCTTAPQLQWSRVRLNAESRRTRKANGQRVDASMEPRSFERGKSARASTSVSRFMLQWSRVRLNAESAKERELDPVPASFNGAAFV